MNKLNSKQIIKKIKLYGDLLELHNENPFKVRSFQNAYSSAKKLQDELLTLTIDAIIAVPGIGKSVAGVIDDLRNNKPVPSLEKLIEMTPEGVREMLQIKGMGPKRILTLWKSLNITDVHQLITVCESGELAQAKGFGDKSQQEILEKAILFKEAQGKLLYADAEEYIQSIQLALPHALLTGEAKRQHQIITIAQWIIGNEHWPPEIADFQITEQSEDELRGIYQEEMQIIFSRAELAPAKKAFLDSFTPEFIKINNISTATLQGETETELFSSISMPFIVPELRWNPAAREIDMNKLVSPTDIKGLVHCHTTYSDGVNSVIEMVEHAELLGYEYIVITDHSKSAGYAGGLSEERVLQQKREIAQIQAEKQNIKIFHGIESDILSDGSLDYSDEFLHEFDVVIASVHSVLNMDEKKATTRVLKALEHPATNILGHSTGRLLLMRQGFPLDYEKIFDACRANNVAIELNANPRRLDIDYTLIQKAMKKGIMIPINPDAHSIQGMNDVKYGVIAGRSGGLNTDFVLNALPAEAFIEKLKK